MTNIPAQIPLQPATPPDCEKKIAQLATEVARLKKRITELSGAPGEVSEEDKKIILHAAQPENDGITIESASEIFEVEDSVSKARLDQLVARRLLEKIVLHCDPGVIYGLADLGREWVINSGGR